MVEYGCHVVAVNYVLYVIGNLVLMYCTAFRYGLETLSQLFFNQSCLPYTHLYIQDKPSYRHRGLMLDVGLGVLYCNWLLCAN